MQTAVLERKVLSVEDNVLNIIKDRIVCFDGAMGTMLLKAGLSSGEIPELYNIEHREKVFSVHKGYLEAGADIITTNTFGANRIKLEESGYTVDRVVREAVRVAREAAGEKLVALDIGPLGQLLKPVGTLPFEEAYELFAEQVRAGNGADLILIETMTDLYEAKAAILAAKENSNLPIFCTMTFEDNGRTMMGTDAKTMVLVLQGLGVNVLGVNCSLGPEALMPIVEEILKYSEIPVMVQPNAGLPCMEEGHTHYNVSPEDFSNQVREMVLKGVNVVGGCCGTTPEYIIKLKEKIAGFKPIHREVKKLTAVCSSQKSVVIDEVKIIGERINPTGKKKFKEAIINNDIDYILNEAVNQKNAGADILDVNVGLPDIDEKEFIQKVIYEIQSIIDLPLQIDSASPDTIEAAARMYNGKPLINSVNGKAESMEKIFPIAKKYGALVVGLTLDENGIPETAEQRLKVADKIISTAKNYGLKEEDILIDCLVLTASAQQKEVFETVKAVRLVKEKYNVKTVLGVSNVSYGFPKREMLNRTFLAMALTAGLNAPIINPLAKDMLDTIMSFRVLSYQDKESKGYIDYCLRTEETSSAVSSQKNDIKSLEDAVIYGLKDKAAELTEELLKSKKPLDIINDNIIPALNSVGMKYENKELYLPQLIHSADTVKKSFEILKEKMKSGEKAEDEEEKTIVIATVKGDIHDIGKNIVKVLLQNYGFNVIDLGKDVPIETVVKTAKEKGAKLVGLSALMTTTVKSMQDTISALHDEGVECSILAGGAVLTEKYASMIGADFYAKDAMDTVRIAQQIFSTK